MFLFYIIVGLLIYLFYLIFRYFQVKANAFSKDEVIKAAGRQAKKLEYVDPEITCDFCGCKIDTRKYKVCPHCGGPYDKDIEWTSRHEVEEAFVERETLHLISKRQQKAAEESGKILARIKRSIFIIAILNLAAITVAIIYLNNARNSRYMGKTELNDTKYENYTEASYNIVGDGVLFDDGRVTITLEKFYVSDKVRDNEIDGYKYGNVKAAIHVINRLNSDILVTINSNSINGNSQSSYYISTFDYFKRNSDSVIYEKIYEMPYQSVSEIIFSRVSISNDDFTYNEAAETPICIRTDTDFSYTLPVKQDANLIFTSDKADVYSIYTEEDYNPCYLLYVVNKADKDYMIKGTEVKIAGDEHGLYCFSESQVPAGYTFISNIHSYDAEEDISKKDCSLSIFFSCEEDPRYDFSTGYISLK